MLYRVFLNARPLLITGDFNFHVDDNSDKNATSFLEICDTFGLLQHVREAIHCNGHSLDLVLSKDVSIPEVLVCPLIPSDHYYVSFTIKNAALSMSETAVTWRRDLKSINRFDLLSSLKDSGLICPFPHKSS